MPGEQNYEEYQRRHNGITWKEYVDLRFKDTEKALKLASAEMNRRLEGMNEIRSQLDRQAGTFPTRTEVDVSIKSIADRMATLEKLVIGAVVSIVIGIVIYFVTRV